MTALVRLRVAAPALAFLITASAEGVLPGTTPANPGDTVFPGLTVASPGTLLALTSASFVTSTGTASGTLVSAVYLSSGNTLDFYYQLLNGTTSTNCGGGKALPCDGLARVAGLSFAEFTTALGFRIDGSILPGGAFVTGSVPPVAADRDAAGAAVAFSFFPPDASKVHPGQASLVLVVSTNAKRFAGGTCTVSDGGYATVPAFQPLSGLSVSGGLPSAVEGAPFSGTVGTFTDLDTSEGPGNFTATIDWGDGTATSAGTVSGSAGSFTVTGSHTFADEGSYSGTLTVHDADDNLTNGAAVIFTVAEADVLAGTGVDFPATPGIPFTGTVATFTDSNSGNPPGDFTATIDWGDTTTTAGTISGGSGNFSVGGSHTYATTGKFTVTTTLSDDAPGTATATAAAHATVIISGATIPTLQWPGLVLLGAAIALAGVRVLKAIG